MAIYASLGELRSDMQVESTIKHETGVAQALFTFVIIFSFAYVKPTRHLYSKLLTLLCAVRRI